MKVKQLKKRVKKYGLEEVKRELEVLGVNIDEDVDETKNKNKKMTKNKLQKLLIKELKQVKHGKTGLDNMAYEEGFMPIEIPEDVISILNDLDTFLDKQLEEQERNEQRGDDVKAVLGSLLDKVDLTLASGLNEKGEKERVLRPDAGDRKEEAEWAARFWSATENHKSSVPRRRFRMARHSSRRLTV
ncbi:hypothetical protein AALO_G00232290 [Alosa alosa]|uniref:Uncharacterized protein n=1 Tax=Alosa alosa TaxID=278164 RepID=A0AAV6FV92_9TELE|nr:hypothetical protein AALO_G00232290 [Alosa alosa]